jgi:hypothetical protein
MESGREEQRSLKSAYFGWGVSGMGLRREDNHGGISLSLG